MSIPKKESKVDGLIALDYRAELLKADRHYDATKQVTKLLRQKNTEL